MQNLIEKYGLTLCQGPERVYGSGNFSLDANLENSPFFNIIANPSPSYDIMFPILENIKGWLDLFLFDYSKEIDTPKFIADIMSNPDLRMVGVYGMILFTESFYGLIPDDKNIVSIAYEIDPCGRIAGTETPAQVPYFHLNDKRTKISVKYSGTNAGSLYHPGDELILIGKTVKD